MMDECRKHAHSEMIYGMLPVVLMGCSSRVGPRRWMSSKAEHL